MSIRTIFVLFSLFVLCKCDLMCISENWRSNSIRCRPLGMLLNTLSNINIYGMKPNAKVIYLYMKSCKVIRVGPAPFKNFNELQLLDLSDNGIVELRDDVFEGLVELRSLNLTNNRIELISDKVLKPLTKLRDLDLSSNNLDQQSGEGVFSGLASLRSLDLSNNIKLPSPSELFKDLNLRSLVVSRSNFVFPDIYALVMPNLAFLDLSNNVDLFESGFMGNSLSKCVDLIHLKMVGIKLTAIEASSIRLIRQIRILNLSGNLLEKLDQDVFNGNSKLLDLDLSWNKIDRLPPVVFSKSTELVVLNLSNNLLSMVQPILFANMNKLQVLDLSYNRLDVLADNLFAKNIQLTSLKLNGNKIKSIKPLTLSKNINLRTLDLSNNLLKTIEFELVEKMDSLLTLDLSNNFLTGLENNFVSKESLFELNLACNQIVSLPGDIFKLDDEFSLKTVFLFGNPWSCGCLNDMMKRKTNVKIDNNNFSDGKYVSCIAGSDATFCEAGINEEYRMDWLAHLEYFPNPCIPKSV